MCVAGLKKWHIEILPMAFLFMLLVFWRSHLPVSAACSYPSQVLDLTNWKQTFPFSSSDNSGDPLEVKQPDLALFKASPYFEPTKECDGVQFRAPVNGATTSGSEYPRSELREMADNGSVKASWSTDSGTHMIYINQAITAVPQTKKHIVAGQIHDEDDDVVVFALINKCTKGLDTRPDISSIPYPDACLCAVCFYGDGQYV